MPEELLKFLAIIGGLAIITIILIAITILKDIISDAIVRAKWKYKRKHRFDKPPTAKCYCIDCKNYSPEDQHCDIYSGYRMAPEWFCSGGKPKDHE